MPEEKKVEVKDFSNESKERKSGGVFLDFEGTSSQGFDKPLVAEDSYQGVIKACQAIETRKYDGNGVEDKIIFNIEISGNDLKEPVELPLFANPIIKKSSGTKGYSNSKLYDLLDKSGLLAEAKVDAEELAYLSSLVSWFNANLIGRKCKVLVKTRKKGMEGAYSSIADVLRFEPVSTEVSE